MGTRFYNFNPIHRPSALKLPTPKIYTSGIAIVSMLTMAIETNNLTADKTEDVNQVRFTVRCYDRLYAYMLCGGFIACLRRGLDVQELDLTKHSKQADVIESTSLQKPAP